MLNIFNTLYLYFSVFLPVITVRIGFVQYSQITSNNWNINIFLENSTIESVVLR